MRMRHGRVLLGATLLAVLAGNWACGLLRSHVGAGPIRSSALIDGGFERDDAWALSAPPDYSRYALLKLDNRVKKSGRRSALVAVRRHPRRDALEVLHAWTQEIGPFPPGARVRFGGWVRAEPGTIVKIGLKCELVQPIHGKSFVTVFCDQPRKYNAFQRVEKVIVLPGTTTYLTLSAGLTALGTAWFDDLFVELLPR